MLLQGLVQCSVPLHAAEDHLSWKSFKMHLIIKNSIHIFVLPVTSLESYQNKGLESLVYLFKYRDKELCPALR